MSIKVRVASRSSKVIDDLTQLLANTSYEVTPRIMVNGDRDPFAGVDPLPDVLIFHLSESFEQELAALSARPREAARPLIVIGDGSDPRMMRLAMQVGSRDFLVEPIVRAELLEALERVEIEAEASPSRGPTTVSFVNAKGGCGASFLAANLAHMIAESSQTSTVLVDLDVQFATIPQYLDLKPQRGLLDALGIVDELDEVALDAYLVKHDSGLKVLTSAGRSEEGCTDVSRRFEALAHLLAQRHECTVIDVPRHLDALGAAALSRSERIILVIQQNLPAIRDAVRLLEILRGDLSVPNSRLSVCVNRYRKDSTIELSDVRRTLKVDDTFEIPNHFKSVSESIDAGIPILEHARQSPVTKALAAMASELAGARPTQQSFIARKLADFLRT